MFMEAFATGFSMASPTKPGFSIENENYKLTFDGVLCDQSKNIVSHGFENCYSWQEAMDLILNATEEADTDNLIKIEEATEDAIRDWLVTFQGWGLLSSILDSKVHRHVVLSLAYTSANWDEETGGDFSEEKVFDTVKYVYDNMPGKEMLTLVPNFGVWFEEIISGGRGEERKKNFTLFFNAKWALEVKFVIEKKRINKNLVDLAAEAVVKNILIEEEIEELDIPEILYESVRQKFRDAEWIRSFWSAKLEVEEEESNILPSYQELEENKTSSVIQEQEIDEVNNQELEDQNVNEEFLASVVDELSSNVEHALNDELASDNEDPTPRTLDNSLNVMNSNSHGIDGLLSVWVFLFLLIAVVAYIWC